MGGGRERERGGGEGREKEHRHPYSDALSMITFRNGLHFDEVGFGERIWLGFVNKEMNSFVRFMKQQPRVGLTFTTSRNPGNPVNLCNI